MSFDWILHARYMGPGAGRGNKGYGGEDESSSCLGRAEAFLVGYNLDVSRNLNYFTSAPSYLGNAGLTGTSEDGNLNKHAINRAVHFMNNVYVLLGENVYIYDEVAGTWSISLVLTGKDGTRTNSLGLYPVFIKDVPHLITAWHTTSDVWQSARLNGDTNTWTLGNTANILSTLGPIDIDGGVLNEIQHKSKIYFLTAGLLDIGWYDFVTDAFGQIVWGATVRHPMDFVTYNSELYCLNKDASRNINLHKITLGGTTLVLGPVIGRFGDQGPDGEQQGAALSTTNNFEGRNLLFVDNVRVDTNGEPVLWAMNQTHADTGGTAISDFGLSFRALATGVAGDLDNAAGFSPNAGFWSNPFKMGQNQVGAGEDFIPKDEDMTMRCFIDQRERELAPGNISRVHCSTRFGGFCATPSQNGSLYYGGGGDFGYLVNWTWLGGGAPGSDLQNVGGPASWSPVYGLKEARHRSPPHEKIGGGARSSVILPDGNKNIDIVFRGTDTTDQDGVMRIYYRFITTSGVPNGTNVAVKWFFDKNLHAPETQCVPTGTSHGSIDVFGQQAVSIPADSGTLFWFDWHVKSNNLPYGTVINLNAVVVANEIETTALNDPTDLQGLTLWLEADDQAAFTSGVNGRVSAWEDKSGAGLISGVFQDDPASQPLYIDNANNLLGGIEFLAASGSFLFSSGSPVEFEPHTTLVIFEISSVPGQPGQTVFSMSNDGPPTGPIAGTGEFYSVEISGDASSEASILMAGQDLFRTDVGTPERQIKLDLFNPFISEAKIAWWREDSFQAFANFFPDGSEPSGLVQTTNSAEQGLVTPSGLANVSGVSIGNTTVGRFSGAQESGVYTDAGKYFTGRIYEIATYNRALFPLEIDRFILYASGKYSLT